jgi:hypothetical protein
MLQQLIRKSGCHNQLRGKHVRQAPFFLVRHSFHETERGQIPSQFRQSPGLKHGVSRLFPGL